MLTIYHNPRCSKSRQTLALIQQNSTQEVIIIEYLKDRLTKTKIQQLLVQLNCAPIDIMRVKEAEFKEQNLQNAENEHLIAAMVNTPKLIERPIVSNGNKAIIGRPPENVLSIC